MTISVQWLIFGGIGIGLFLFGLFAKNSESGKSEKEDHMQTLMKNSLETTPQHESEDEKKIAPASSH
jgi:hypothetical protein